MFDCLGGNTSPLKETLLEIRGGNVFTANLTKAGEDSLTLFMKLLQFVFVINEVRKAELGLT